MREYRGRQRDKLFNRFGAELARARSTSAVNVLASAMLRRFGSPDRLGEAWAGAIETARKSRRSVRSAILSYFAILRAMDHAEGQDTDPLGLKTANAKELKEAMYEYLLAHPEDALAHPEIKVSSVNAGRCREQASPQDSLLASGLPQIANGER
jgi:hypothetical protein